VRAVAPPRDFEIEPIAGRDRTAELRLVDAQKVHERIGGVERLGCVREDAAYLRERFENEHPGHDRPQREVALKPWFSHAHALVPGDALARHDLRNAIDQNERPSMRQNLQDAINLERGAGFHPSPRGLL
jgi:hypothetical protein